MSAPKVALVTGASSGIGKASAIALSKAGFNVVITARREEALQETANQFTGDYLVVAGDLTQETFVQKLFKAAVDKFGRIDVVFNNAGSNVPAAPMEETTLEQFLFVQSVNVTAPWLCTREAMKIFKAQSPPGGRIINNGSISAHVPRLYSSPYTMSKHAISGLTKSTALDGRQHGITVTQIDIGNAATDLSARMDKGTIQADGSMKVEPRFDVQHVADSIVHVANLPNNVTVLEMNIMATGAPYVGRG
ncbi:hypothetical protein DL96DRAFT_1610982 [Flagelloscypha sp. PMI_526]|nr:hypothetical protein DL96DRAFT_1610982 [Flagelloscypha sp. PMI_526]